LSNALDELFVSYDAGEDRLLLRMKTLAGEEARAWITRRVAPVLWRALTTVTEADPAVQAHADPQSREAMIDFSREQALASAEFRRDYEDAAPERRVFAHPLLVRDVSLDLAAGEPPRLLLHDAAGNGMDLRLGAPLAHAFCRLLADGAAAAGWGLDLGQAGAATRRLN